MPRATAECRKGVHDYAAPIAVGAGLERATCRECGAIMLDLSELEEQGASPGLFGTRSRDLIFAGGLTKSDLLAPAAFAKARRPR